VQKIHRNHAVTMVSIFSGVHHIFDALLLKASIDHFSLTGLRAADGCGQFY